MKHDHTVAITVPDSIEDMYDKVLDHIEGRKVVYALGLGVVIGAFATRIFSRPLMQVIVVQSIDEVR